MPLINVDFEPYEYVSSCRKSDIKELIEELIDRGHLPPSVKEWNSNDEKQNGFHPSEAIYETALDKLHGKYSILTQEEEETILKIANRL